MHHNPPMPKESISPFPLKAAQSAELQDTRHDLAKQAAANLKAAKPATQPEGSSRLIMSLAAGAAAVAAAMLYFNRSR